jgi:hypothetical protein
VVALDELFKLKEGLRMRIGFHALRVVGRP